MFANRSVFCFLFCMIGLAVVGPHASGQDNPIAKAVRDGIKDPAKPFTMIVHLKIKKGAAKKFHAAFAKAQKATRKEKGNITYDLNRHSKKANEYLVYERWRNFAALEAHLKTEHITTLIAALEDMLEGPPEVDVLLPIGDRRQ